MFEIFIDGDACPVKDEVLRVAARHHWRVHLVANQWLRAANEANVEMVVVGDAPDAADDWIAEHIGAGDIAVTADIPLADRCLKRGAAALGPTGRPFDAEGIGMAMAMRDLSSHLRDTGAIRGGGPAFGKNDRSRFLQALEAAVQKIKREY